MQKKTFVCFFKNIGVLRLLKTTHSKDIAEVISKSPWELHFKKKWEQFSPWFLFYCLFSFTTFIGREKRNFESISQFLLTESQMRQYATKNIIYESQSIFELTKKLSFLKVNDLHIRFIWRKNNVFFFCQIFNV